MASGLWCFAACQSRALAYIEQCLGVEGLLNGQSLDLHYATLPHNRETTERIARGKTVSLIRLTLVLPAMLGGASAREIQLLERIALYWGLGYQMVDDLKDVLDSADQAGKTVARDILLDRPNVASAMGIPGAVLRLTRFIYLGDTTLHRLLESRPELSFLGRLRSDLEEELVRVTENASRDDLGSALVIFLNLIVTNLRRHRIRSFISIAGIAFSVAAMLTVVTILQGAVGMFSGILSSDSEIIVFERNVSDLFFSNVPAAAAAEIAGWPMVSHADPVLFGIVSSADHPIITCFGVTAADARIRKATWLEGDRLAFAQHADDVVLGERAAEFLGARLGEPCVHRARSLPRDRNSEDGQRL